jgi:hypothetical protein
MVKAERAGASGGTSREMLGLRALSWLARVAVELAAEDVAEDVEAAADTADTAAAARDSAAAMDSAAALAAALASMLASESDLEALGSGLKPG